MNETTYTVLKAVSRGQRRYLITEPLTGIPLVFWMNEKIPISKEQLFQWMKEMIEILELYHTSRGNPCYQYINPYSVIIGAKNQIGLLDLKKEIPEDLVLQMKRKKIRQHFLSLENQYYQNPSVKEDIYSLGKMYQYLLAEINLIRPLTYYESRSFKRYISRCLKEHSKKQFHTTLQMMEQFPIKEENKKKTIYKPVLLAGILFVCLFLFFSFLYRHKREENEEESEILFEYLEEDVLEPEEAVEIEKDYKEYEELLYDAGLLYYCQKEYGKSKEVFQGLETYRVSEDFVRLCIWITEPYKVPLDREVEEVLDHFKKEWKNTKDIRYMIAYADGLKFIEQTTLLESAMDELYDLMMSKEWEEEENEPYLECLQETVKELEESMGKEKSP